MQEDHGKIVANSVCKECDELGNDTNRSNLVLYEDGYAECSQCPNWEWYNQHPQPKKETPMVNGNVIDINKRKIGAEICSHFNYTVGELDGLVCQAASYYDSRGNVSAQLLKFQDGNTQWAGDKSKAMFFGQHLYNSGKTLAIANDPIAAMSVATVVGKQWPCVAFKDGVSNVVEEIKSQLQWLNRFDSIVLFLGKDDKSLSAIDDIVKLLPDKIKVANFPSGYGHVNDMLVDGKTNEIKSAYWHANDYVAVDNDIIDLADISYEELTKDPVIGYDIPYNVLSDRIGGLRKGEVTTITAGSGIGKSTLCRRLGYHLAVEHKQRIGNIYLEEGQSKTAQGYIALHHQVPLGELRRNPKMLSEDQYREATETVFRDTGMISLKHFGSMDSDKLISKLEYMTVVKNVDFIILDHITIVTSGNASNDERKDIAVLMTKLRTFCERTGVGVVAVVHLKRPSAGKSYNEGREISLQDLKGASDIEQLSDNVIALERNQQKETEKNYVKFRVLKCREFGEATGEAGYGKYNTTKGYIENSEGPKSKEQVEREDRVNRIQKFQDLGTPIQDLN